MNIPVERPALELCSVNLYSTGARGKVFTKCFYTAFNHNFGAEIVLKNNTGTMFLLRMSGCVYDTRGNTICQWRKTCNINAYSKNKYDFYIQKEKFVNLKEGVYKIKFWVNNTKVQSEHFEIKRK